MKCFDPVLCYTSDTKNRVIRNYSFVKKSLLLPKFRVLSDCGKCLICRKKKSLELAFKCVLHSSLYQKNCFLTLTYDEKKETYHNNFERPDIQKFVKRLRRWVQYHYKKRIEVFYVHEYGKNGKKHWHLVVFNHDFSDKTLHSTKNGIPLYTSQKLQQLWPYGFNTVGNVEEASAMYQAQYMQKDYKHNYQGTSKKSASQHSGIGKGYFLLHYREILSLGYISVRGRKIPVPRSFEKIGEEHWSYFNDVTAFFDIDYRKKKFRMKAWTYYNKNLADLYATYREEKKKKVAEYEKLWSDVISHYIETGKDPDFRKAGTNALYDLKNKTNQEIF